jgi:Tfp pilus assembly protein PilF
LKPDVVVTDVRITTSGKSSLMLAGLTAVIAKGQQDTTPAQIAQARQALSDAMKAIEEKKPDQAEKLLHTALQSDPSLTAARQALADLHERQGNEAAALQPYQAWATARATTPLPYNRIGEILEKRKDYPGALAAYTQSLVVEWNQPPIIEAKSRVQKIVLEKK